MESAEYKKQYDEYLARAEKALSQACERYLPEGSDVCRAARYSLLGGGKRIRAVLVLGIKPSLVIPALLTRISIEPKSA